MRCAQRPEERSTYIHVRGFDFSGCAALIPVNAARKPSLKRAATARVVVAGGQFLDRQ